MDSHFSINNEKKKRRKEKNRESKEKGKFHL
jgi:hypothetical protein